MRNAIARRHRRWIGLVLSLLIATWVTATDGRDFAGFYELGEAAEVSEEEVRVPLTVRVFNYSDAEVFGATVTLEEIHPPETYGSFPGPVDIPEGRSVRLSAEFTIPRRLYDQWQQGIRPLLFIEFQDAEGNTVRRPIELVQIPVGEEE